jgi:beta-lactamase class A
MPKLANSYEDRYYQPYRISSDLNTATRYNYSQAQHQKVDFNEYRHRHQAPKRKKAKRKSLLQVLISVSFLMFLMFKVLPFSYSHITKAMINPVPYKDIKVNLEDIAFPTHNYLSNSWFLGKRGFMYSENENKAQMVSLKENVNMPVLKQELENLIVAYPSIKPAIFVWDYETQNYVDINGSKVFSTASIIKIPVLIDVFKSIEAGQISLNDTIPLTEYYRSEGSGSLQFKAVNSQYTIDELARRMITESDNSATNMLVSQIGSMTDVNQEIRDWGLKNTGINTWLPDLNGTNYTTARDMATILYNIDENDKFLSEESRDRMLDYMGHVHNNRLIQAGLGAGSVFLHKTGDIGSMLGDAGIVITPNGKKYIVVILANRPHNSFAGKEFIVSASEIIYNYMVR